MKQIILFFLLVISFGLVFNSCQKEYSFENPISTAEAKGSLTDSLGNCLYDSVYGTFYNGVAPGGDTAYVELQVQVDSVGNYRIYTDLQNGFMLGDSGFFNKTGINSIKLKPVGIPLLQTVTDFAVTFSGDTCHFAVYVQDSTGTGLGGGNTGGEDSVGTWEFYADSAYIHGNVNLALFSDTVTGVSGIYALGINGTTAGDSTLVLMVIFPGNTIDTGTYVSQGIPSSNALLGFSDQNLNTLYSAINDPQSQSLLTIHIDSYNSTTRVVTGTFSGSANIANTTDLININNGKFTATVSP